MRFAALQGSSTNDYINAGKAAADATVKGFAINRKTGPDYGELAQTGMAARSAEKQMAMKTGAQVTKAGINAVANVNKVAIKESGDAAVRKIGAKLRKAGAIAGLGRIAGAGYLASRDNTKGRKRPSGLSAKKDIWNDYQNNLKGLEQQRDSAYTPYKPLAPLESGNASSNSSTESDGGPAKKDSTSGSLTGANTSGTDPLAGLTKKDFDDMAFTISSEAALGTDDVYGVAANLVTRLRSGKYGDSIHAISHAPGQYEGVYTGRSVASPEISAQLQSPEGRAKIIEAYNRLDGRTEFKGQSMLRNRVKSEDPMFDPKGNFYHYAGQ